MSRSCPLTTRRFDTPLRWLFANHGLVAEGAGAAAVAAVLAGKVEPAGQLVVVISGRNIAADRYADVLREP